MSSAECWRLLQIGLVIAASWLSACATGGSEQSAIISCPPVVAYDRAFLGRAAEELGTLPQGSAIERMLADYAVMRSQMRLRSDK